MRSPEVWSDIFKTVSQPWGLDWPPCLSAPTKLYSVYHAQLGCHSSLNIPWLTWPWTSLPWAPEPTINVLFTLLYTYPSMYSLFSLDPSRVCPFLCGQDCPECLTPRQDGISVCWLNNSGKGLKFEWNWCEWKRDESCHNIVKENLAQLKGKKEKQKTGKRF